MNINLSLQQKKLLKKIAKKYGINFAVVFGSKAKGQGKKESDFDIAVLLKKNPTYKVFRNLFSELSDVFKGENIDIRFLNEADPFFRFEVVKQGRLIYGDRGKFQEYSLYAYKSFIDDAKPLLSLQRKLIYEKQKELEAAIL